MVQIQHIDQRSGHGTTTLHPATYWKLGNPVYFNTIWRSTFSVYEDISQLNDANWQRMLKSAGHSTKRLVKNFPVVTFQNERQFAYPLSRAERGLLCYEKCSQAELRAFCKKRSIAYVPKNTNAQLASMLEQSDEDGGLRYNDLPAEVRVMVYELHLDWLPGPADFWRVPPPITAVNKQIRKEILPLIYDSPTAELRMHLWLHPFYWLRDPQQVLSSARIRPPMLRHLRNFTFRFHFEWAKSQFTNLAWTVKLLKDEYKKESCHIQGTLPAEVRTNVIVKKFFCLVHAALNRLCRVSMVPKTGFVFGEHAVLEFFHTVGSGMEPLRKVEEKSERDIITMLESRFENALGVPEGIDIRRLLK